jgi:hypothetical protein
MIRAGTLVRLKVGTKGVGGGRRGTARVRVLLSDIKGGIRLDSPLGGFSYWNREDLERADKPPKETLA